MSQYQKALRELARRYKALGLRSERRKAIQDALYCRRLRKTI